MKMTSEQNLSRKEITRQTKPILCYAVENLPSKKGGQDLYSSLRTAVKHGQATLTQKLEIPAKDALSWKVPAGHLWRIVCTHGPQVADMNCWSLSNPEERFYSSKTRQIHATHLTTGDRLWSNMPYLRPLATITEDTIAYGFDEDGAGVHDVIGSRAAARDGLTEMDVHDVLNVFMCTGFTRDTNQYFTKPSPVEVGDYIEFLAETDLLVSASTCPQGDVSLACGGGGEPDVYPLGVEIYKLETGWLDDRANFWQVKNEGSFASVCITLPSNSGFHCESDAVITMSHNVDVRGSLSGGFLGGLARAFLTRESFFTTNVRNNSTNQSGDALIAPTDPGGIALHQLVHGMEVILTSGAYLAADEGVHVASSVQSPFSLFGNYSGTGVFLLRASGRGTLAISAYGSMHKYVLSPGEKRNVDNGHLVAWTASMKTSMKFASARAGIVGSMTSGEGLHCEFVGPGVVYIQSHKPSTGPEGGVRNRNGGGSSGGGNFIGACIGLLISILVLLGVFFAIYFGSFDPVPVNDYDGEYNNGNGYRQQQYGRGYRQNEF
ncbi:hypothetical protein ACHAXR_012856 [Thalassiosira sp. AJA248-18]